MEWMDIETAPKDGTHILIIRAGEGIEDIEITEWYSSEHDVYIERPDGLYKKKREIWQEGWKGNGHRATHWMPLPNPPHATDGA